MLEIGSTYGESPIGSEDFGIGYNMENGGPAQEGLTDKIYENTTTIKEYLIAPDLPDVDITTPGVTNFTGSEGPLDVEVFDSASDYIKLMNLIGQKQIDILFHSDSQLRSCNCKGRLPDG